MGEATVLTELEETAGTGSWTGVDASDEEEVGGVERTEGAGAWEGWASFSVSPEVVAVAVAAA